MTYFVNKNSIVREIWGNPDTILFIFAGAAAEFALNKAVDWLYFTGRLPADPLGRLFSTVVYSQKIIFSERDDAYRAIDQITAIHKGVEENRGATIPDWAYRDVLFMLIYYSISSYEVLQRKLSDAEKEEIFTVFYLVGERMGLTNLPKNYTDWCIAHNEHVQNDTVYSEFTSDLYKQYKKHLGYVRYQLLKQVQVSIVPKRINHLLKLGNTRYLTPVLWLYKLSRKIRLDNFIITTVLPGKYRHQLKNLRAS
jgi:ER-bound oxygenase mpaB/B'/Rubber oxygenase, catalytic domain